MIVLRRQLSSRAVALVAALILVPASAPPCAAAQSQTFGKARLRTPCITRQELTARALGLVSKFHASDGDAVRKGDAIVTFDARRLRAGIKEAQGAVDAAKGNVDLAFDASARLSKLTGGDSVTEQQIAEARIKAAQAQAVFRQAQGALEGLKVQLEDTVLRAEIAGTVRGLPTILGMAVQPGQSLGRIEAPPGACAPESRKN